MQFALPAFYIFLFILLIYKMNFFAIENISRKTIVGVFILKVIAGIALWWLYTYKLPGSDMHDYFNDGNTLFQYLFHNFKLFSEIVFNHGNSPDLHAWQDNFESVLYNDSHTMILLNLFFRFFSFGNFHVHTIFMCFISFVGFIALYKTFVNYFEREKKLFFILLFLIPSVMLWSSGVLKEGLLFFGLGMLLYASNCGLRKNYNWKQLVIILISLTILLIVKFYVFVSIFPALLLNIWISRTSEKLILVKFISIIVIFCSGIFVLKTIDTNYNPLQIIADKQAKAISEAQGGVFLCNNNHFVSIDYNQKNEFLEKIKDSIYTIKNGSTYLQWELDNMKDTTFIGNSNDTAKFQLLYEVVPANTNVKINRLQPNLMSVLKNAPIAFIIVLTKPLIWEIKNAIQLLPAIENIFFLLLIVVTILFFKKTNHLSIVLFCFSFVVILFVLIGITTPSLGAIVRYKIPAIPFLCVALLLLIDMNKLGKRFPFISKLLK